MSGCFVTLLKARQTQFSRLFVQQRATYIHAKPPKDKIGGMETAFVLTVMFTTILGPSGWILSNLDHYKAQR